MHHLHIDRFAGIASPVHRLDPRAKLIAALLTILLIVLTPDRWLVTHAIQLVLIWGVIFASRVPAGYILKRSLPLLPLVVVVAAFVPFITPGGTVYELSMRGRTVAVTDAGLLRFGAIVAKAYLSFFAASALVATTRFGDLMWAAGRLKVPAKLVLVISFMYRYLFILIDEVSHMLLARELRSPAASRLALIRSSGGIVGAMFVRSYEHAQRLYAAMLLRGYSGRPLLFHHPRVRRADVAATGLYVAASGAAMIVGAVLHG